MSKGRNLGGENFSKTDPRHKDYWATPQEAVDNLVWICEDRHIVPKGLGRVDVCASDVNKKFLTYISEEQDTLKMSWGKHNLCWMNPPYSNVTPFLEKAVAEVENGNYTLALMKNDCSTKWFAYAVEHAIAIIFITRGRINFVSALSGEVVGGNNFSSVVFVFGSKPQWSQRVLFVDKKELQEN